MDWSAYESRLIPEITALDLSGELAVVVSGGRDFRDFALLSRTMDLIHFRYDIIYVLQGGATGADRMALLWAQRNGIMVRTLHARWKTEGDAAGPIRNQAMLDIGPDLVVGFPGGIGTADMLIRAHQQGFKTLDIQTIIEGM